jgi:hypothetical protein
VVVRSYVNFSLRSYTTPLVKIERYRRVLVLKRGVLNLALVVVSHFPKKVAFYASCYLYGQYNTLRAWTTYMGSVSPGWGELSSDSGGAKPGV